MEGVPSGAAVTVTVVLLEKRPDVAVIVVVPCVSGLITPLAETVATAGLDDVQVTRGLRVEPSSNVPVTITCLGAHSGRLGLAGVIASDVIVLDANGPAVAPMTFQLISLALAGVR